MLKAMNRRNGEKEKEGRSKKKKKNRTGLTDSSIGTQQSVEKDRKKER